MENLPENIRFVLEKSKSEQRDKNFVRKFNCSRYLDNIDICKTLEFHELLFFLDENFTKVIILNSFLNRYTKDFKEFSYDLNSIIDDINKFSYFFDYSYYLYFEKQERINKYKDAEKTKLVVNEFRNEIKELFSLCIETNDKIINTEGLDFKIIMSYKNLIDNFSIFFEKQKSNIDFEINNPFRDIESKEFFNFILLKWKRKTANKWGYFWNFIFEKSNGKLTSKVDFENFLIENNLYKGKLNYESCNSDKVYLELEELLNKFKHSKI